MSRTLMKPYLMRTPHPTNVMPLQRRGKRIPVAGSLVGPSMTTSPPPFPSDALHWVGSCARMTRPEKIPAAAAHRAVFARSLTLAEGFVVVAPLDANVAAIRKVLVLVLADTLDETWVANALEPNFLAEHTAVRAAGDIILVPYIVYRFCSVVSKQ
jgi:hypothetical protein